MWSERKWGNLQDLWSIKERLHQREIRGQSKELAGVTIIMPEEKVEKQAARGRDCASPFCQTGTSMPGPAISAVLYTTSFLNGMMKYTGGNGKKR